MGRWPDIRMAALALVAAASLHAGTEYRWEETATARTRLKLVDGRVVARWTFTPRPAPDAPEPTVADAPSGYRGIPWGSSRDEVMLALAAHDPTSTPSAVLLRKEVAGLASRVRVWFRRDGLGGADQSFFFPPRSDRSRDEWFRAVRDHLSLAYGPAREETVWTTSLFRDDPGFALVWGYRSEEAIWETADSLLTLRLWGKGFRTYLDLKTRPRPPSAP